MQHPIDHLAMFSLRRPFASALQRSSSGRVVQSLPARLSSTMSVAAVTEQEYEALTIPPIFDIFDAPVRLGKSSTIVGRTSTTTTARILTPESNGEKSWNIINNFTGVQYFSSLPPPIVFDGPACPAHLLPQVLENRRKMRQHLSSSPTRQAPTLSPTFTSPSEPVYEIFDGPSRITRYKYPTSSSESSSRPYVYLTLAISGAFGWLVMKEQENRQQSGIRPFP